MFAHEGDVVKALATAWVVIVALLIMVGGMWAMPINSTAAIHSMSLALLLGIVAILLNRDRRW